MRNPFVRLLAALLCTSAGTLFPLPVVAQEVGGVTTEQIDDTVKVHFIINAGRPDDLCRVNLLVSTDGGLTFNIHPRMVKGLEHLIPAGKMQELIWVPLKEGIELNSDRLVFKVTADVRIISDEVEFITIQGGEFVMGDFLGGGDPDEIPLHAVALSKFELSKYEVTNRQFARFLEKYGSTRVRSGEFAGEKMFLERDRGLHFKNGEVSADPGYEDVPATSVTWFGANEFCRSSGYRLPTEAEWEYAARVQGKNVQFGNGKDEARPEEMNYDCGNVQVLPAYAEARARTLVTRVGMFPPNGLGIFDMSGNVWEWCQDWYDGGYYQYCLENPRANPAGPWFGDFKVLRGGGCGNNARGIRTTERTYRHPGTSNIDIGFRVARN